MARSSISDLLLEKFTEPSLTINNHSSSNVCRLSCYDSFNYGEFIGYQFSISLICARSLEHAEGYL